MIANAEQELDKQDFAPKKFILWLIIFASFMLFAAFTSGFIVYSGGAGKGIKIILPQIFMYSTLVLVASSVTMFLANKAAKQLKFQQQRLLLWASILLGAAFFILQVRAWSVLIQMGVYLVNPNASQSFIYIFTGMHLLHIVAGICVLLYALYGSYKNLPQFKNLYRMEIASIFWHFLDILWIYLYVFLLLNQY